MLMGFVVLDVSCLDNAIRDEYNSDGNHGGRELLRVDSRQGIENFKSQTAKAIHMKWPRIHRLPAKRHICGQFLQFFV